jgi:hypothetical protein
MRKLESYFNPEATEAVEDYSHRREMTLDQFNFALFSTVTFQGRLNPQRVSKRQRTKIKGHGLSLTSSINTTN